MASDYVAEVIGLPADHQVEAMVGIGHPAKTPNGHPIESLDKAKVHLNRHGNPFHRID